MNGGAGKNGRQRDPLGKLSPNAVNRPRTAADQVADLLREAIVTGEIPAETILRQDDLAARFELSRMPVRDALRSLEAEGLITIHPTRGAFVSRIDAEEAAEIYAIRALVERKALKLSFPHLTTAVLDRADAILQEIDHEQEVGHWGQLNRDFHMELYSLCGNSRLLLLVEQLHRTADRYVRLLLSNFDHRSQSQHEHRQILDACRKGDRGAALHLLKQHLEQGRRKLVKHGAREKA